MNQNYDDFWVNAPLCNEKRFFFFFFGGGKLLELSVGIYLGL